MTEAFIGLDGDGKINFLSLEDRLLACTALLKPLLRGLASVGVVTVAWLVVQCGFAYEVMVEQQTAFEIYVKDHAIEPLLAEEKEQALWVKQLKEKGKLERSAHRALLYVVALAPEGMQLKHIRFSGHGFEVEGLVLRQDLLESYQSQLQQRVKEVELRGNAHKEGDGEIFSFRLEGREKGASKAVATGKKDGSTRK